MVILYAHPTLKSAVDVEGVLSSNNSVVIHYLKVSNYIYILRAEFSKLSKYFGTVENISEVSFLFSTIDVAPVASPTFQIRLKMLPGSEIISDFKSNYFSAMLLHTAGINDLLVVNSPERSILQ